jgi:hypothetical protein
MKKRVILSTPLLLEEGLFSCRKVSLQEAQEFAVGATNYVAHSTVKVLGIEPAETREVCSTYDAALCIKVHGRISAGVEYSVQEILDLGVDFYIIEKLS